MRLLKNDTFIFNGVGISAQLWPKTYSSNHSHTFYEISYVLSGRIRHVLNGADDDLEMNDLRLFTLKDKHELSSVDDYAMHRDILIEKELFENFCLATYGDSDFFLNESFPNKAKLDPDKITELELLMNKFTTEPIAERKRGYAFEAILKSLNEIVSSHTPEKADDFANYPKALKEIIDHFNMPLSLKNSASDIIAKTGYNPSYISRLFKKHTGDSLSNYLKNLRLKHVSYYLKNTDLSLREIADIVGIESLSYLNSIFKKKYSVPPVQYRREYRK